MPVTKQQPEQWSSVSKFTVVPERLAHEVRNTTARQPVVNERDIVVQAAARE